LGQINAAHFGWLPIVKKSIRYEKKSLAAKEKVDITTGNRPSDAVGEALF
jgi:hypothetical protein